MRKRKKILLSFTFICDKECPTTADPANESLHEREIVIRINFKAEINTVISLSIQKQFKIVNIPSICYCAMVEKQLS